MEQPILSISILISGKYENVKRCLDSIQPILKQVPSELILTDTGCSTQVRELIEKYTDNIIDFEWIQDFSAARNAGLKLAKGQWFMYLDDDEWFDDTAEIVQFFLSDEEKDYDVATYYQRNYGDENMSTYLDYAVDRIIRHVDGVHFENRVHEEYIGINVRNIKQFKSFVHHMGYVYKDENEKLKKYERNGSLLEQECREKPDNMRLWHQYAAHFWTMGEWDKSMEVCKMAIKRDSDSGYWDMIHTDLLYNLFKENKWEEIIEYGEEFLKKTLYPYEQFGVRQFLLQAYFKTNRFDKVCELTKKVINTYRYYKRQPEEFSDELLNGSIFFSEENIGIMLLYIIVSAVHERNTESAELLEKSDIRKDTDIISRKQELRNLLTGYMLQNATGQVYDSFLRHYDYIRQLLTKCGYYEYLEEYEATYLKPEEKHIEKIVLNELTFEPTFFEPETRDGFYIEPLMKNAWAAQLEMLNRVDEICTTHNIGYFLDWGTMLGAVRHRGYIPWDDDIDIGMLRADYRRFCQIIGDYDDVELCNEENTPNWGKHAARITTRKEVTIFRSDIKAHRGFPFPVGLDIFVVDYLPDDEALRNEQKLAINQISAAYIRREWLDEHDYADDEYADKYVQYSYLIHEIENTCGMKFSQEFPTCHELLILVDEVIGMYGPEDGGTLTQGDCFVGRDNYFISAEAYAETIRVPFENMMAPIPVGYDEILRVKYGDDYMTPMNTGAGHGYPYYDVCLREMFNLDEEANLDEAREYVEKMASDYYRNFINKTTNKSVALDNSYYEDSNEEGTLAGEETKRIRAAELEILSEIQRMCREHGLTYYAYGETLIGAIRHNGFAPGDEDICIALKRDDYMKFLKLLQTELGAWFDYEDIYTSGEHADMRCYVMTDGYMVSEELYRERFHGCPHQVAVCLAAIDGIPNEPEVENMKKAYVKGLLDTAQYMPTRPPYDEATLQIVEEWRKISDIVINTNINLKREFTRCADVVAMACGGRDSEHVRIFAEIQDGIDRTYERAWFDKAVEMPFETMTINVPVGYEKMLQEIS
ncbi:MAG: LicD family protein [Lachnobacterium sp.]|nr:LicD family protein [Lachnobacterium sp.]